ncbi:MAG: hypothetical protein AAGF23_05260, partial [Acidobacteriota bacterium]
PGGRPLEWSFGDGSSADAAAQSGPTARHTYRGSGRFTVEARRPDGSGPVLRGLVAVRAAAPPEILDVEARAGGREIAVRFDEAVDAESGEAELEGVDVRRRAGESSSVLVLELESPLERPATLRLEGILDRADPPNALGAVERRVTPARWPARPEDLVFLWQSARHPNRVQDADGRPQATLLDPRGPAFTDRHGAMVLRGGAFQGDIPTMQRLLDGAKAGNELTLELSFEAERVRAPAPGALFAFGGGSRRHLILSQEDDRLVLRLATASHSRTGPPAVDVGRVTGGPQHLAVSYSPGQLLAVLDGEVTAESTPSRSGFFHWRPTFLRLGAEGPPAGADAEVLHRPWRGRLEGVAVYGRALDLGEALDNRGRYGDLRARRVEVPRREVGATLVRRAEIPSLEQIAPYREALAVFEYRTDGGGPLSVVHRVLLDGRRTAMADLAPGTRLELRVEPFSEQTQLESLYLSELADAAGPLSWSDRLEP